MKYFPKLSTKGSCKLSMADLVLLRIRGRSLVGQFPFHPSELGLDILALGTFQPGLMPVDGTFSARSGTGDAQHVLRGVLVLTTRSTAVPFEVADQRLRIVTDFPKVNLFATTGEQEEAIELGEQLGGRLMDRGENRLAVAREFLQELDDCP